ncbi:MAG TPA: TIGR03089 family protein [Micromonosporaceae bacterium]|nr:TIGR03089 family protein [Micromonosporaceae bacterium]
MFDVRTVGTMFIEASQRDPARPLLTYYDDGTGERTEVSAATLGNWVAKTANMLVDDCGLGTGNRAAVGLPPHWQTAAVLLACWSAGLSVTMSAEPCDVAFVAAGGATHEWPAGDRYALGLHPMALPLRTAPDGYLDYTTEVRAHGDHFAPPVRVADDDVAWRDASGTTSHAELCARAADRARELGIADGGRALVDADTHPDPLDWLLAPLAAGASVVLCRNTDNEALDTRAGVERVTVVVG